MTTEEIKDTSSDIKVMVYSKSNCYQCKCTTDFMTFNQIEYEEVNLEEDEEARELVKGLGYSAAPVVIVTRGSKEVHWYGFRPDKLRGLVGEHNG